MTDMMPSASPVIAHPAGRRLSDSLAPSIVVMMITTSYMLAYSALLFGGAPGSVQAHGLFIMLCSLAVLGLVGARLTTQPHIWVTLESSPMIALAGLSSSIIAAMPGVPEAQLEATLITGLAITSLAGGITFLATGMAKVGPVVRFLPLQMMAGITAASGLSMILGGIAMALGNSAGLSDLASAASWLYFGPACLGAVALHQVSRRVKSPLAVPLTFVALILIEHAVFELDGLDLRHARAEGWLLPAIGQLSAVIPWAPTRLAQVDWNVLARMLPASLAVVAISGLNILLTSSSIEHATRTDTDIDRDMRAIGIASIVSACLGGLLGNISESRCKLLYGRHGTSRAWPLLCSLVPAAIPMAFPQLVDLVPRTALAALLIYLGLRLISSAFANLRERLTWLELSVVPTVMLVDVWFDLSAAVFAGMALGCITFAVMYSSSTPIRARYRGDVAQSNVDRSAAQRAKLAEMADAILVIYLQGFLFFGTASRLMEEIRETLRHSSDALKHVVLEASNIDGFDGSAIQTLDRLLQVLDDNGVTLTFASLPAQDSARLQATMPVHAGLRFAPSLDAALEQCEAELLGDTKGHEDVPMRTLLQSEVDSAADLEIILSALEPHQVAEGDALMLQGETSDNLVFIETGEASVMLTVASGQTIRVRQFGPGTMVGEIGFLLGTPRTATVRATSPGVIWTLSRAAMLQLEAEHPSAALQLQRAVMRRLSRRILDKDHLIQALIRSTRAA